MAKILMVYDSPPPFGGVRVSAAQTARLLRIFGRDDFVDFKFDSHPGSIYTATVSFIKQLISTKAVLFLVGGFFLITRHRTLLFITIAKLFHKQIIYRGFGGGMEHEFKSRGPLYRGFLLYVARRLDIITFQTKDDAKYFTLLLKNKITRIIWLPNTREINPIKFIHGDKARRYCFFGKVCQEKGVHLIAEARLGLPDEITIDVYGELTDGNEGRTLKDSMSKTGVRYIGAISPELISSTIGTYDCLLLPTTWRTEGYPGVVLEAFAAGIPVIVTRWNALPELVDETCGILIEPGSAIALREAILMMHTDIEMWSRMQKGALRRIEDFNPEYWAKKLHQWMIEVVEPNINLSNHVPKAMIKDI